MTIHLIQQSRLKCSLDTAKVAHTIPIVLIQQKVDQTTYDVCTTKQQQHQQQHAKDTRLDSPTRTVINT